MSETTSKTTPETVVETMAEAPPEAPPKAFVSGCAGLALDVEERALFAAERPWGLILFGRNIGGADQIRALVDDFRRAVDDPAAPVLIDQEGGRVQRLRGDLAPDYPSGSELGALPPGDAERAVWLLSRLHAIDLSRLGIDVDCLPVADVPTAEGHAVIGSRAYASDPVRVADLARAACDGLLAGGVLPVIKHMPGHGRAPADSHEELPRVAASREALEADFAPFRALADMPLGMTAHVVYEALDAERPATLSPVVIGEIVRGALGFDGLLMSDDMSMRALAGPFGERTRALLAAGCDVALHCNGVFEEMRAVAEAAPALAGRSAERSHRALAMRRSAEAADEDALRAEFQALTGADVRRRAA